MAHVEMYSTVTCPSCTRAKQLLGRKGVEVEVHDVSDDRSAMIERADGRRTVPQIFINGVGVGGFDAIVALDREGELDDLLAAEV